MPAPAHDNCQRIQKILGLALPIIMAQASQNLVNLIDTALVGQLGNAALAGAGLGGFACYALQALPLGLAVGVQALVARRKGEEATDNMAHPLGAGLLLSLVGGVLLTALLYPLAPALCRALSDDPKVAQQGALYLQMRLLGTVFISLCYCLGGFWNAIYRPRIYLGILLITHIFNVLISYILIFGQWGFPPLGILGAGLGTAVSWALGAAIALPLTAKQVQSMGGFWWGPIPWKSMAALIKISLPNGIQQLSLFSGFAIFYWIVGLIGTRELAAAHVLVNILMIAILIGLGFGMASASLVGQALGREETEDASRWGWQAMGVCFTLVSLVMIALLPFGEVLLSLFIHDPITRELTALPFILTILVAGVDAAGLSIMYASLGAGNTVSVMKTSMILQWGLFLPLAYGAGPVLGLGLLGVWGWFMLFRLLQTAAFSTLWYRGQWKTIQV